MGTRGALDKGLRCVHSGHPMDALGAWLGLGKDTGLLPNPSTLLSLLRH